MSNELEEIFAPQSLDHLKAMIGETIVASWTGGFKGIGDLWKDYEKGDCRFVWEMIEGLKTLVRKLRLVRIYVYYQDPQLGLLKLKEDFQQYADEQGVVHQRTREGCDYAGGRVASNKEPIEGAVAEINEELFATQPVIDAARLQFVQSESGDVKSDSFPGLHSKGEIYVYRLFLTTQQFKPLYQERPCIKGKNNALNQFSWVRAEE